MSARMQEECEYESVSMRVQAREHASLNQSFKHQYFRDMVECRVYLHCRVFQHQTGRARQTNGAVKCGHVVVAQAVDEFDLAEFQKHRTAKPRHVVTHGTPQKGGGVLVLTDQHRPAGGQRHGRHTAETRQREREERRNISAGGPVPS